MCAACVAGLVVSVVSGCCCGVRMEGERCKEGPSAQEDARGVLASSSATLSCVGGVAGKGGAGAHGSREGEDETAG